jgi:5'-nucleotidase
MNKNETLHVAFTGRTLFDLKDSDQIFKNKGLEAYSRHMLATRKKILKPGPAYQLIKTLGELKDPQGNHLVNLTLLSQNHADTGIRLLYSIQAHGLRINRTAFTGGAPQIPYLKAFGADLFLSFNNSDVINASAGGIPSALLIEDFKPNAQTKQLRIAFDGDAVLFGNQSEKIYQKKGLASFRANEIKHYQKPLAAGPFKTFLSKLHAIKAKFPKNESPIRIALVTARETSVLLRPLLTLESWGLQIDEAIGLDGSNKAQALQAFAPHIFFDDNKTHVENSSKVTTSGLVPWN